MAYDKPAIESPLWWTLRLHDKIAERADTIEALDDYYSGNHPVPWLPHAAQDEFRDILKLTRSNYMGLVVDAMVERMSIEGFRVGDKVEADAETWALWQWNNMDAEYDKNLLEAAIGGSGYLLVAPNPKDQPHPFMWVEHASQAIVEHVPGTNRRQRAAAAKVWIDDWTGDFFATTYLADGTYKYRAKNKTIGDSARPIGSLEWVKRQVGTEEWPLPNLLGEVPMVETPNNPRLLTGGVSELIDLTDVQDRINKTIADRIITQDFGAFPQKWATGYPVGDVTEAIRIGRQRLLATDIKETQFGQFQGASLDPYSNAKREDVKDIASRSRTPAQYLLGEMSNVNGETLKASESGLVSKVRQRMRGHSDPVEEAVRMLRKAAGLPDATGQESMETIWRNPEFRTEGELVDALVKMSQLHVPDKALWERWGATPKEIARWEDMQKEQARRMDILSMMADKYRTDTGATGVNNDRGSVGGTENSGTPSGPRDADGDGVVDEKSNRAA